MNKALYANCYLEFDFGSKPEGLVALVSEQGALHIQFHKIPYSKLAGLAGKSVEVLLCGKVKVKGKLCREVNLSGAYYRMQFENLDENARGVIREAIAMQQYPAPWERKSERFPSKEQTATSPALMECPQNAVIARENMLYDLAVVDFSRDGILLEGRGEIFSAWHVGDLIKFKLFTNQENKFPDMDGIIVRIAVDYDRELNQEIFRFGVQFSLLDEFTAKRYGALLDKYLEQKALEQEPIAA